MDERRWEDLQTDCLVNILGRVGMECLLLDVPFVCKSWYKATLDPQCWKLLDFPIVSYYDQFGMFSNDPPTRLMEECKLNDDADVIAFTKFVIKRSKKSAVLLSLPPLCHTEEMFSFVATECPDLKTLVLPEYLLLENESLIPNLVSKLNQLQEMVLPGYLNLKDIFAQISMHCRDFVGLVILKALIGKDEASAIPSLLPNLKYLVLMNVNIRKDDIATILQGCKLLVLFDGSNCIGFNEDDEDIIKLASHIPQFTIAGSKEDPLGILSDPIFEDPNFLSAFASEMERLPDIHADDFSWD